MRADHMSPAGAIAAILATAAFATVVLWGFAPRADSTPAVQVGETVPNEHLHIVTHPGRYGLGSPLPGSSYAVVGDVLVRVDATTGEVQSTIRKVTGILD